LRALRIWSGNLEKIWEPVFKAITMNELEKKSYKAKGSYKYDISF